MRWRRPKKREQDLERELRSDLELEAAAQEENGLPADEARYAARRAFGNTSLVKEEVRDMWGGRWFEDFLQDLGLTARHLRKAPGFTAAAVISLALGIGGNTAIFTLIDAVLLKSLPVRNPSSLVLLGDARGSGSGVGIPRSRFLPNVNPIGRRFGIGGERDAGDLEIVGVVGNAKYDSPREEPTPMAFLPLLQVKAGESESSKDESHFVNVIEVRSTGRPDAIAADVRHALGQIDPRLPVLRVSTLSDHVSRELNQENVVADLAMFFGLVGLILSCLGLYGLLAYTVQRRTSEMGVRIALGASRASVIGMVVREALTQGLIGISIGIPAAFAAVRLVANQLYGVSPNDPRYSAGAALVLLLCVTIAGYVPARRASRIDPLIALRYE